MSLESLERTIGRGVAVGAGAMVAGKLLARRSAQARFSRLPEGGLEQSLLPFYAELPEFMAACAIDEYASSGGLAKQALLDPMTEFDPANETYAITDPRSEALRKATLYRDGEWTLRDFDLRVFNFLVDEEAVGADAHLVDVRDERKKQLQGLLDAKANELGLPRGPAVSLFIYEDEFRKFRPWHYATRTQYDPSTNMEHIYATTEQSMSLTRDELWKLVVDLPGQETLTIPVNSPATHLGRTLVRPLVERQRDRRDVDDGVRNIRAKGLGDELLGERWEAYLRLRGWLDTALSGSQIEKRFEEGAFAEGANMLFARYIGVPLAPVVENSELGAVIRDPDSSIGRLSAGIMGA